MKNILITTPLLFMLLSGAAQIMAQDAANTQDDMQRLQTRMDELKAQMNELQAEVDAIHGVNDLSAAAKELKPVPKAVQTGAIQRTMPALPPAVQPTPEQQRAAIDPVTSEYETFSEESEAAPRLYNVPLEPTLPGFFVLPGTQTMMRINGILKTDFIFDPRPAGVADAFIPSSIPVPQISSTKSFNLGIRESRFSADLRIPVSNIGTARTFIQFDFFGANGATTPRLRHFYGQLDNILVGQTNTVFMDPDAWPDILDFQGPTSGLLARPPQFRYSFLLGKGFSAAASVEQPISDISFSVDGSSATAITPAPDGAVRLRYDSDRGHLYLSSVFRELSVHLPNNGPKESAFGWGLNFSSTWRVVGRDVLNYQVAYGNGIARYTGDGATLGLDAQPRTATDLTLKALPVFAPWVSYQHHWTRSVRSSATFGWLQVQNTAFQPENTYHKSSYSSANIIWNTVGSLSFGAEFMYGWVEQKDRATANAPRLQFSGRYTFVKLHEE
ncbi:MAG TPA: DcaP family trimeric outer membrane transporter [Pseudacidobacterium sp.]|nr:DcaP family trimeric outer membrane transporter [Pseudacidobacterium sp.]